MIAEYNELLDKYKSKQIQIESLLASFPSPEDIINNFESCLPAWTIRLIEDKKSRRSTVTKVEHVYMEQPIPTIAVGQIDSPERIDSPDRIEIRSDKKVDEMTEKMVEKLARRGHSQEFDTVIDDFEGKVTQQNQRAKIYRDDLVDVSMEYSINKAVDSETKLEIELVSEKLSFSTHFVSYGRCKCR